MTRRTKSSHTSIKSTASRAIVPAMGQELNRIVLTFDTNKPDPERIVIELDLHQAARLIEQLYTSYNASVPVLKTARGGFGL